MLNQPTSSPMMKTMFGFFPDDAGAAPADFSEQQGAVAGAVMV